MPRPPATTSAGASPAAPAERHPRRADAPRYSGKRVTVVFGLLLATIVGGALVAFLQTRTPDGPVLAMVAIDDHQAVVLRADPRRGHTYLTVETAQRTARSLALFGVPPGSTPLLREGLVTVPVTGARGAHEVDAFELDSFHFVYRAGQPDPETSTPDPARLPLTVGEGPLEVALYGEPLSQAVVFRRADGQRAFRVRIPPLGEAPAQVWPTPHGFVLFDGRGVARSYDRRHAEAERRPRDPQPVGGPGASFCAVDQGWLFLTRAGSLHLLSERGVPTRLADGLPADLSLLGCGRRHQALVLFLGHAVQRGVERVLVLDPEGQLRARDEISEPSGRSRTPLAALPESRCVSGSRVRRALIAVPFREPVALRATLDPVRSNPLISPRALSLDLSLAAGEAQGPRLDRVGALPRFVGLVDGAGALQVVDLQRGLVADDSPPCAGVGRLLITPEGSFASRAGALVHVNGATGALRSLAMPGLDPTRTPRREQLSPHHLFVPAGSGFAVVSRAELALIGSRALELQPVAEGCGGSGTP